MHIYIPSRDRAHAQRTLGQLPPNLLSSTTVVVPPEQVAAYAAAVPKGVGVWGVDARVAEKRQAIVEQAHAEQGPGACIQLDDDLAFFVRVGSEPTAQYVAATPEQVGECIQWLHSSVQGPPGYCWAQVSNRFMAHTKPPTYQNSSPSMAWAVHTGVLDEHDIRFDALPVCEDWHVCLSLLEAGYPNVGTAMWVVTGSAQNKNGGCSSWRTAEVVRAAQQEFVRLHPHTSRTVPVKGLQQGCQVGEGLRVQWKRAYEMGRLGLVPAALP